MNPRPPQPLRTLAIALLTLATAAIHISLLFPDFMFILNGLGYLVFLGTYLVGRGRLGEHFRWARYGFIAYTGLTILLWLLIGARTPLGYITKIIEIVLVGLLVTDRT
ncbi:hypothetical protein [uncultured Thermanaerothrix sp.]|uniref:hypothetical protein n=1 Tax=uncultured Thermanaerothrix sp. TaxID=1195149 RepID=UPI002637F60D|nr:hypothetical protein [uncultured Thermanaerothrix sp.]